MSNFPISKPLAPWRFRVLCAFLATVGFASLHAQNLESLRQHEFKFEHISVEHGLSQCTVGAIYQDRRGFLWIGTSDGLNRYDGYGFKHYKNDPSDTNSLSHNGVTTIAEDGLGRLWIGTAEGGLNRFDPQRDRFIRHQYDPNDPQSLSHNHVEIIFEDSFGVLWIGTRGGGLNAFDRKTEKFIRYRHEPGNPQSLSQDAVNGIFEDKAKTLWIFTRGALNRFDRRTKTFKPLIVATNLDESISAIYEDHSGQFWIGTLRSGLKIFDRQTERFTQAYRHDPRDSMTLSDDRVSVICEDLTGALWIATQSSVNRFDRATGKFLRFRHDPQNPNSLSRGVCTRMYCDRSGLLWIETDGSGLNKLDPRPPKFTHLRHEPNNRNSLSNDLPKAICEDRFGDLWIGNVWGKLDRFNRRTGKFSHYQDEPNDPRSLSSDGVYAIYEDKSGDLWIGAGNGGLNRFDRERENFANHRHAEGQRLGLTHDGVNAIGEDHEGYLWLGGDSLRKYDKRTGKTKTFFHRADNPNSLSNNQITVIYADQKGTLWVGTVNGLNRFEHATATFKRYLHEPANPNSLGHNYIKTIFEDDAGQLWIGTQDGLNKLDPTTGVFTRYHEKDGLPNTFIYGILGDDHGNLWMSTNRGLSKFNPLTGRFRNYDLQDGLQSYEFNTGAYHRSKRTGEMFFGGINGINIFHPDSVKDDPYAPPIVITDFKKFDLPMKLKADIANLDEIKLAYEENVFSFEFAVLDFTHPEKNQYAYMLAGFDHDWVYCGTRRFARYTNLDPGDYTFRVKGTNHDGVWNEQGASIKITIVPPFWMTWWFKVAATVVVLSAVAGAARYISARRYRRRLEALERQQAIENERKRISKDMHDEIGANLTKIAILSELMQNDFANAEKLRTYVQKISETAHATVDNISEIIWAINPQNNTLDNLSAYLRKCTADCFEMTPVRYRLDFPETVPGYPITAEFRRHIFMVVKEAIHNIVKHAKATEMEMKLISNDHMLEILIQDDGRGFIPETLNGSKAPTDRGGGGNGLRNMSKRMAEVGGQFEIQSQPQQGTKVRIFAKIK
jgi:ligand-binding sensor domain-containing protein/signal transduction histidine kinase